METTNVAPMQNLQFTTLETLVNEGKEILFIEANRQTSITSENVKGKMASLKEYGVLTPFQLIPAAFVGQESLTLLDENGTEVTDSERIANSYCLMDGNNRYKARMEIKRKAEKAKAKGKEVEVGKALEDVPVVVLSEKPAKGVLSSLIEINTSNVKWKYGDYASTALKLNPNNEILKLIKELKDEKKFSPSSISLYLTFNSGSIKEKNISDAIKAGDDNPSYFAKVKLERAKRILRTLEDAGFDNKTIRKRYLIDFIIENADNLDNVLKAISDLKRSEVDEISSKLGKSEDALNLIVNKL